MASNTNEPSTPEGKKRAAKEPSKPNKPVDQTAKPAAPQLPPPPHAPPIRTRWDAFVIVFRNLSPWVLLGALALILVAALCLPLVYDIKYDGGKIVIITKNYANGPAASEKDTTNAGATQSTNHAFFRGFYFDVNWCSTQDINSYLTFEDLDLSFPAPGVITGTSSGVTRQCLAETMQVWRLSGFRSGEYWFMSYMTTQENGVNSVEPGNGSYVLHRNGRLFSGYIMFHETKHGKTLQCPYILSPDKLSLDQAKREWKMLNDAKCNEFAFPNPDAVVDLGKLLNQTP